MNILIIGLNHKTAQVEIREKLAFNKEKLVDALAQLSRLPEVNEIAILSTCNRVELYCCVSDSIAATERIKQFLSAYHGIARCDFESSLYIHTDTEAIHHIFRVASSLDSMVVGEPQILGQIKDAYDFALKNKTTSILLNRLLKKAIFTAKRVRTETRISENAVSISFAAVELARKIFTDLSGKSFMLLGAGEMAELAARHLVGNGVQDVVVANRTYSHGCTLAEEFHGRAVQFEHFLHEMVSTDIVICSTGASSYVLMKEQMQKIMKERRHRPVFIIDISVPRNIDPEINKIDGVYLYDVDDLQEVVATNRLERNKEAQKAEEIIAEEIEKFTKWLSSLDSVPIIVALRQRAEGIKQEEFEKFSHKFPQLGELELKAIEYMASAIVNKLIHPPTVALKEDSDDRQEMIALVKKLYGINGDGDEE